MVIYIGADHRGFELKESLKKFLIEQKFDVIDLGNDHYDENDDYPDFAKLVAQKVSDDPVSNRGILVCHSGVGVDIVANKFKNVRSGLITSAEQAKLSRVDDDINVLSISSELTKDDDAKRIANVWLKTEFSGLEKDRRRLGKIDAIDK